MIFHVISNAVNLIVHNLGREQHSGKVRLSHNRRVFSSNLTDALCQGLGLNLVTNFPVTIEHSDSHGWNEAVSLNGRGCHLGKRITD